MYSINSSNYHLYLFIYCRGDIMINIVLYFWSDYDGDCIFNRLVKFFKEKDYEFAYDMISNQILFRNIFEDDCRQELKIDIRSGDACKLGRLRPDFYFADTKEARNFLEQVDGILLKSWWNVIKLVELFRG